VDFTLVSVEVRIYVDLEKWYKF